MAACALRVPIAVTRPVFLATQGCGIDTTNAAGTLYTVRYAVVSQLGKLAAVNRTIEVTRPCPVGEELCSEDNACSEDCSLRYA